VRVDLRQKEWADRGVTRPAHLGVNGDSIHQPPDRRKPVRIGVLTDHPEKAALEMIARRVHSGKGPLSTTCWAITTEARSCPPLFWALPDTGVTFRGPNAATRLHRTSDPLEWSWSLTALPRYGRASRKGNRRSGKWARQEAIRGSPRSTGYLSLPVKRKAALCPKSTATPTTQE
jgi:hypothetical protein